MDKMGYKALILPNLTWNQKSLTATNGEFSVQPLEPGFGITLGNAVRRILLGAVEGCAVSSVIIKGVNNEFASVPGVVEDVMQLVLNIKQIVIKNKSGKPGTMRLQVNGPATVKVSDIKPDSHIELVNGDHVLAHVATDGNLDITFFVENGRGYREAQWPADKALTEDGRIYLDAMFSPIRRVSYEVEKTRVGGEIDYDKLSLSVVTDGSENPVEVTHYAVSVLRTQLEHFLGKPEIAFNEISREQAAPPVEAAAIEAQAEAVVEGDAKPLNILLRPIEDLNLSVRAYNCLVHAGIKRVIDLVNLSRDAALKIKNLGNKSLKEIEDVLKKYNLHIGMTVSEAEAVEQEKEMQASGKAFVNHNEAEEDEDDEDDDQD